MKGSDSGCGILMIIILIALLAVIFFMIWKNSKRKIVQPFDPNLEDIKSSILKNPDLYGEDNGRLSNKQCEKLLSEISTLRNEFIGKVSEARAKIEPYAASNDQGARALASTAWSNFTGKLNQVIGNLNGKLTNLFGKFLTPEQKNRVSSYLTSLNQEIQNTNNEAAQHTNNLINPVTPVPEQQTSVPTQSYQPSVNVPTLDQSNLSNIDQSNVSSIDQNMIDQYYSQHYDETQPTYDTSYDAVPSQPYQSYDANMIPIDNYQKPTCDDYFTDNGNYCSTNDNCYQVRFNTDDKEINYDNVDKSNCINRPPCNQVATCLFK